MAMQRQIKVQFGDVFPNGVFLVGEVEKVGDYDAKVEKGQERPQAADKETGLPLWTVQALDADPEARKSEKTVTVKFAAKHQPVPPENTSGMPFTPVEFVGLTATPWVDSNGSFARLAWSFRAEGMTAPGEARKAASGGKAAA